MERDVVIAGGGIFGITAAIALRRRGFAVTVFAPGPLPHPLAESTDISKVIRMDYGADEVYLALMEEAMEGWRRYNARWPRPLYHETGVTFLTKGAMVPGSFEHESHRLLTARGYRIERLDAASIWRRFPAWRGHTDGISTPPAASRRAATWWRSSRDPARSPRLVLVLPRPSRVHRMWW